MFRTMWRGAAVLCAVTAGIVFTAGSASAQCGGCCHGGGMGMMPGLQAQAMMYQLMLNQQYSQLTAQQQNAALQLQQQQLEEKKKNPYKPCRQGTSSSLKNSGSKSTGSASSKPQQ